MGTSNIDVTLTTSNIAHSIKHWTVINCTDSDHYVIKYTMRLQNSHREKIETFSFDIRRADWVKFTQCLVQSSTFASSITTAIQKACLKTIPRKVKRNPKKKQPWWDAGLANLKKDLNKVRRLGINVTDRQRNNAKKKRISERNKESQDGSVAIIR